jgi:hypothetical protein
MLLLGEGFARKPNILPMRADIVVRELKEKMDSAAVPGTIIDEALLCRTDEDRLGIVIRTPLASVVAPTVVRRDIDRRGVA